MMKRMMACLLALVCLMTAFAFAEGELGDMKVIKVKEAVNLRKGPGTDTASLGTVPLGAIVNNCTKVKGSDWIAVNYNGVAGYIRGDFLEAVATEQKQEEVLQPAGEPLNAGTQASDDSRGTPLVPKGENKKKNKKKDKEKEATPVVAAVEDAPVASIFEETQYDDDMKILDATVGDVRVVARQIYEPAHEYLMAVGLDASGKELWKQETVTDAVTELQQTDAFMGGTADKPILLMYNACRGLTAINPTTGEVAWELAKKTLDLGGSICHAVDANGVAYIGGYYGPDPVAIDASGNVLWQASSGSEGATWLYSLELQDDGICCYYVRMANEDSGTITYDFNGNVKEVTHD